MRINKLSELENKIDKDLAWRKKELISIISDIKLSQNKSKNEQLRLIKMGIIMLYAHWEGAIKNISEYYLNYVSSLKLEYRVLKKNFLAIEIKSSLKDFTNSNKATIHNKVINDIYNKLDECSKIPVKNVIKTDSNLKMEVLQEIAATLGIDSSEYELKKIYVDQRLLGNRNKIVHGQRLEELYGVSGIDEYVELHREIHNLIDLFALNIINAATNELYKV